MKEEKRRIPRLRFPEFTDDWEQKKISDVAEIFIGLVTTMTENYTNKDGVLLIRNSDIREGYFQFDNPIYLNTDFADKNKNRKHKLGDVITVHTGDIGTSAVITKNEEGSIGFATIVTRCDTGVLNNNYLCSYLNTDNHKKYAQSVSTGDGRSNYNLKDFNKTQIPLPKIDEQIKIANLIYKISSIISVHQSTLDHLKLKKKSLLQKLFPKNGEKFPELRFPEFTDAWEQRKLGDIAVINRGLTYKPQDIEISGIRVLRSSNIVDDKFEIFSDDVFVNEKAINIDYIDNDMILVTAANGSSHLVGKHAIVKGISSNSAVPGGFMLVIKCNNPIFMNTLMSTKAYSKFINSYVTGGNGAIGNLKAETLKEFKFLMPQEEEQEYIEDLFNHIDNIITLHQRKLDHLKLKKKALLQQMFV